MSNTHRTRSVDKGKERSSTRTHESRSFLAEVFAQPAVCVPVGDVLPGLLRELRLDLLLGVEDVLPQKVLRQNVVRVVVVARLAVVLAVVRPLPHHRPLLLVLFVVAVSSGGLQRLGCHVRSGLAVPVPAQHVRRDPAVVLRVELVQHDEEQVETRQQRVGQPDVVLRATQLVVLTVDRVRCGDDAAGGGVC